MDFIEENNDISINVVDAITLKVDILKLDEMCISIYSFRLL